MLPDPIFVDEALANLDAMEQILSTLPGDGIALDSIHTIFRYAHSVKGGAAAFEMADVADLMHQAESLLDQWRIGRFAPDARGVALLRGCLGLVRDSLIGTPAPAYAIRTASAQLRDLADVRVLPGMQRLLRIELAGCLDADTVQAVGALFRDIEGLGQVMSQSGGGAHPWQVCVRCAVSDTELMSLLAMHVDQQQITLRPLESLQVEPSSPVQRMPVASVRVPLTELSVLDRLVGELSAVSDDMVAGTGPDCDSLHVTRLREVATELHCLIRDLRSGPASELLSLVPPVLVNLSSELGKSFRLSLSGESLRLDRQLIQALADPLIQLVRNGCDHGIEAPEQRRLAGKPADGLITISFVLQDGWLTLSVRDDGRGLSRRRMLDAARARGMEVPEDVSDESLWPLMFAPGFSTAHAVTSVSGRGVGMDLVQRKVEALGGTVSIESVAGVGTRVAIVLPCGLAPAPA